MAKKKTKKKKKAAPAPAVPHRTLAERIQEYINPVITHVDIRHCEPGSSVRMVKTAGVNELMRPSGTEPLIRVTLEGMDEIQVNQLAVELADVVRAELAGG